MNNCHICSEEMGLFYNLKITFRSAKNLWVVQTTGCAVTQALKIKTVKVII